MSEQPENWLCVKLGSADDPSHRAQCRRCLSTDLRAAEKRAADAEESEKGWAKLAAQKTNDWADAERERDEARAELDEAQEADYYADKLAASQALARSLREALARYGQRVIEAAESKFPEGVELDLLTPWDAAQIGFSAAVHIWIQAQSEAMLSLPSDAALAEPGEAPEKAQPYFSPEWVEPSLTDHVRKLGCKCSKPLLGYSMGLGPRCRLCGAGNFSTIRRGKDPAESGEALAPPPTFHPTAVAVTLTDLIRKHLRNCLRTIKGVDCPDLLGIVAEWANKIAREGTGVPEAPPTTEAKGPKRTHGGACEKSKGLLRTGSLQEAGRIDCTCPPGVPEAPAAHPTWCQCYACDPVSHKLQAEAPPAECSTCRLRRIGLPTPGYPHAPGCPEAPAATPEEKCDCPACVRGNPTNHWKGWAK